VKEAADAAFGGLRAELASVKRTSQDSDVVVRQSLANILFLIYKFGKKLQFHLSEDRIASNERDLRLTRDEPERHLLSAPPIRQNEIVLDRGRLLPSPICKGIFTLIAG